VSLIADRRSSPTVDQRVFRRIAESGRRAFGRRACAADCVFVGEFLGGRQEEASAHLSGSS